MLVFDLAVVAKALVQFEHSLEVLVFNLDASLEATVQFEQATEVDEAFLGRCLRLLLDCVVVPFGHARIAALPLKMVDSGPRRMVSLVTGGCYESSCNTLPQPLVLAGSWQGIAAQHPLEVVHHPVLDACNLFVAFAG